MNASEPSRAERFAAEFERTKARRSHLATRPNKMVHRDVVVTLTGRLTLPQLPTPVALRLSYVPDRVVLEAPSLAAYLAAVAAETWPGLEEAVSAIVSDFGNELVTRWTHVAATAKRPDADGQGDYVVIAEERQPGWDNPALLSRAPRL